MAKNNLGLFGRTCLIAPLVAAAFTSCSDKKIEFAGSQKSAMAAVEPATVVASGDAQSQNTTKQGGTENYASNTELPAADVVVDGEEPGTSAGDTTATESVSLPVSPPPVVVDKVSVIDLPPVVAVEPTPIAVEPTPIAVEPTPIAVEPTAVPYVPANDTVLQVCLAQQSWLNVFSEESIAATPLRTVQASNANNQVIWTDSVATSSPNLIRVKIDTLNANKGVIELLNPNGFYCVNYTGEVLNNFTIKVACNAQILVLDVNYRQSNLVNVSRICR